MADNNRRGGAFSLGLIALIAIFYLLGLATIAAYARYQGMMLNELAASHDMVSAENAARQLQIDELKKDNNDLRRLLGQPAQPSHYPPTNDPSDNPNPDE